MLRNKSLTHLLIIFLTSFTPVPSFAQPTATQKQQIVFEMRQVMKQMLDSWYPKSMDMLHGGFFTTYTYDFKLTGPQDKMIVTQARHTWTNAKAALLYGETDAYRKGSAHGFQFLKNVMWDRQYGGFYNLVDRQGNVKERKESPKEAYGNAFGIYALAAYYAASGDTAALNLAKTAFMWLEKNSHDPIHKGYFQHLHRNGKPVKRTAGISSTSDIGYKDQNSSIHLLEAFTELYQVWPDPLLRERLTEMLILIRDRITTPKGFLTLFLKPDWKPITFRDSSKASILRHRNLDHVSFGHDVETAYLMIEASHILGLKNDTKTLAVAKRMVDHALNNGWDNNVGGFFDEGYYFKTQKSISIIKDTKNWWAQAEGLNTLLLMANLYPNDKMQYFKKFQQLWNYVQKNLIDHQYGDWYEGGLDKQPHHKTGNKGHIWKATYHQYRALSRCIEQLLPPGHETPKLPVKRAS